MNKITAVYYAKKEDNIDISDVGCVRFETKDGHFDIWIKDGMLDIVASKAVLIMPSTGSNMINIAIKK